MFLSSSRWKRYSATTDPRSAISLVRRQLAVSKHNVTSGTVDFHPHRARRGGDAAALWVVGELERKAPP